MPVDKLYTVALNKNYDIDGDGVADKFTVVLKKKEFANLDEEIAARGESCEVVSLSAVSSKTGKTINEAVLAKKYKIEKRGDDVLVFNADFIASKEIAGGFKTDRIKEENLLKFDIISKEGRDAVNIDQYATFADGTVGARSIKNQVGDKGTLWLKKSEKWMDNTKGKDDTEITLSETGVLPNGGKFRREFNVALELYDVDYCFSTK